MIQSHNSLNNALEECACGKVEEKLWLFSIPLTRFFFSFWTNLTYSCFNVAKISHVLLYSRDSCESRTSTCSETKVEQRADGRRQQAMVSEDEEEEDEARTLVSPVSGKPSPGDATALTGHWHVQTPAVDTSPVPAHTLPLASAFPAHTFTHSPPHTIKQRS